MSITKAFRKLDKADRKEVKSLMDDLIADGMDRPDAAKEALGIMIKEHSSDRDKLIKQMES